MGDITQLITAIAALVTALGGAMAAVIVAIRSGNAQARVASRRATDVTQVAQNPGDPEGATGALSGLDPEEMKAVLDLIGRFQPSENSQDNP